MSSPESVKIVRLVGRGLQWEGFVEKVSFESTTKVEVVDGESGNDERDETTSYRCDKKLE